MREAICRARFTVMRLQKTVVVLRLTVSLLGGAGRPISVIFYEVFPPNPVAEGGIPD